MEQLQQRTEPVYQPPAGPNTGHLYPHPQLSIERGHNFESLTGWFLFSNIGMKLTIFFEHLRDFFVFDEAVFRFLF